MCFINLINILLLKFILIFNNILLFKYINKFNINIIKNKIYTFFKLLLNNFIEILFIKDNNSIIKLIMNIIENIVLFFLINSIIFLDMNLFFLYFTIVDIGSNSMRLTVYEVGNNNFKILLKQRIIAGLASYVKDGRLTEKGERMSRMAMHPRLANMIIEGASSSEEPFILAAIVEEGVKTRETDIRRHLDEVRETPTKPYSRRVLALSERFRRAHRNPSGRNLSEGALLALAYPDRIARNRGNGHFVMTSGRGAFLEQTDTLFRSQYIVCCNLDDMTPEDVGFAMERLFDAGALDVFTTPIGMKKNRPAVLLTCMCREETREAILETLFRHTTTLGVRASRCDRYTLSRTARTVDTAHGPVRVKSAEGFGVKREKAEFDDLARIARETGRSLREVRAEI